MTLAGAPDGVAEAVRPAHPIDLDHLARQTMGDRQVEAEVLALFARQATSLREQILRASEPERRRLAHTIKGAARGVGAHAVADCAAAVELSPAEDGLVAPLVAHIGQACDFIAALGR